MTASERREEIMKNMVIRREDKISNLALEFGISERTIRRDIEELSCVYPIMTAKGNGGGVFLDKNYHPYKMSIPRKDAEILAGLKGKIELEEWRVIEGLLTEYSSLPLG